MNEILFEVLKIAVTLAVIVLTRYAVPCLKMFLENSKHNWAFKWAEKAVKSAQQTRTDNVEKKAIVTEFLKEILMSKNISLSDKQIEVLVEAAVKQMKIEEKNEK